MVANFLSPILPYLWLTVRFISLALYAASTSFEPPPRCRFYPLPFSRYVTPPLQQTTAAYHKMLFYHYLVSNLLGATWKAVEKETRHEACEIWRFHTHIAISWIKTLCSLRGAYRHFEGKSCVSHQGMKQLLGSSVLLRPFSRRKAFFRQWGKMLWKWLRFFGSTIPDKPLVTCFVSQNF